MVFFFCSLRFDLLVELEEMSGSHHNHVESFFMDTHAKSHGTVAMLMKSCCGPKRWMDRRMDQLSSNLCTVCAGLGTKIPHHVRQRTANYFMSYGPVIRSRNFGPGYMITYVGLQGPRFHSAQDYLFWEMGQS